MSGWCSCNPLKEAQEKAAKWDAIVRCGDCVHSYEEGTCCRMFAAYEPIHGSDEYEEYPAFVDPNGYCYLGERKEDA